jgi:hypothetical protein
MTLEQMRRHAAIGLTYAAVIMSAFGFITLMLSCVGVFGMTAYPVSRQTDEIGTRMALGPRGGASCHGIPPPVACVAGIRASALAGVRHLGCERHRPGHSDNSIALGFGSRNHNLHSQEGSGETNSAGTAILPGRSKTRKQLVAVAVIC